MGREVKYKGRLKTDIVFRRPFFKDSDWAYLLSSLPSFLSFFGAGFFAAKPKDFCHSAGFFTKSKALRSWSSLAGLGMRRLERSSSFSLSLPFLDLAFSLAFAASFESGVLISLLLLTSSPPSGLPMCPARSASRLST